MDSKQGDQIGRIFAYWAIVSFGQFIENYRNFALNYALILTKNGLDYNLGDFCTILGDFGRFWAILGDFFTNVSCHPAWKLR
jgi:hypothetical protein